MLRFAGLKIAAVLVGTLVGVALVAGCTAAEEPVDLGRRASFRLARGVVVDPVAGRVYTMAPGATVEALRLRDGVIAWGSKHVAQPLLAVGDIVVAAVEPREAQPRDLIIALLQTERRGRIFLSGTMRLPEQVTATLVDGPSSRLSLTAAVVGGEAGVAWRYVGGRPGGKPSAADALDVSGAGRIDLETGRLEEVEPSLVLEAAEPALPAAIANALSGEPLRAPAWRAGSLFAAVTTESEGEKVGLQLRRIGADGTQPRRPLSISSGTPAAVRAAADGHHLLVAEAARNRQNAKDLARPYTWTIYDVADGRRLGSVDAAELSAAFCVVDDTLIYELQPHGRMDGEWHEETRKLVARDVTTSRLLWERPLRDPIYRGPMPPPEPDLPPTAPSP